MRRLTFESASMFGLYDRGLLRPGMAADIVIFDPDTVQPCRRGRARLPDRREADQGAGAGHHMTVVNGEVLMEDGKRTGSVARPRAAQHLLPGQPSLSREAFTRSSLSD